MYKYKIDSKRLTIVCITFFVVLMILGVRLYFLMIYPSNLVQGELEAHQLEYTSNNNYKIFDTEGNELIKYNKKYVMVLDTKPFKLNNYEETLEDLLALNFIMKTEDSTFNFSDIMQTEGKFYYTITEETYNKINKLTNIKGIYCYEYDELDLKERWKIENAIASIDVDNVVEGSFEEKIADIIKENEYPNKSFSLDNKSIYYISKTDEGEENKNIRLTINNAWTEKIREVLNREEYSFLSNIGVVLLEADTGKIRAMVQKDETEANVNLGIGLLGYEPGSIFKTLTDSIALNEGLITNNDTFECTGEICTKLGEKYAHGPLTVNEALQVSCNDVFAQVGNLAGYDTMLKYTTNLGLYSKVLGFSGENREEAVGSMPPAGEGVSNFSIGQSLTVTPLQMAGAINAITNDGVYIKPTLIEAIVDNDNNIIEKTQEEERRVFSSTTAKIVQNAMHDVIWKGTGYEAKVEGINQGGKTGTSTGTASDGSKTNHGWFAGYFELGEHKYTLVVIAPNIPDMHPDGRELGGGNTGAPIYRQIIYSLMDEE